MKKHIFDVIYFICIGIHFFYIYEFYDTMLQMDESVILLEKYIVLHEINYTQNII